jgi:hypothetical protein
VYGTHDESGWDYGWYQSSNASGWSFGWYFHVGWESGWFYTNDFVGLGWPFNAWAWSYGWHYDYGGIGGGWNIGAGTGGDSGDEIPSEIV